MQDIYGKRRKIYFQLLDSSQIYAGSIEEEKAISKNYIHPKLSTDSICALNIKELLNLMAISYTYHT